MNSAVTRAMKPNIAADTPRLKTIVFATDFSEYSRLALLWTIELAKAHGAKVAVVHAMDTDLPAIGEARISITEHIQQRFDCIREQMIASKVEVTTRLEVGQPWKVLADNALAVDADLVVVGAHGRSSLSDHFLGTVADRLIRTTDTPVIVHREGPTNWPDGIRNVVAATDFSEDAMRAINMAIRVMQAPRRHARLVILHTVPLQVSYSDFGIPATVPEYWDEAERIAAHHMERLASSLRTDHLEVEVRTFRGYPAESILHLAESINADLIAIGTAGRSGIDRFLLGSTAERVLHHAHCPVLAARQSAAVDDSARRSGD